MSEPQASREMTPDEIVAAAERMDVVDHAITIPAMWPRLILERERARKSRYYDAPEPDDLQRRCWAIDDGQCRLYNGHEGGHDFGGGAADPYYTGRTTQDWHREPEPRAEGLDPERLWMAVLNAITAYSHPDRRREFGEAVLAEYAGTATPDRADPELHCDFDCDACRDWQMDQSETDDAERDATPDRADMTPDQEADFQQEQGYR